MATDYWKDPHWVVQAEAAEWWIKEALAQRRWTDKDGIMTDQVQKGNLPIIPPGEKFAGERAVRVFFKVEDFSKPEADPNRVVMKPPEEAVLTSTISVEDARRAGVVDQVSGDAPLIPILVVPARFFIWVAGALSFDKKVLLTLSQSIMERSLLHKDADIWPELVWITPMKEADRKYYYSVLPLVGMGGVIDPQKGNPSIYASLQPDPYRNIVWQIVDEIIDGGTSVWGQAAASGDGAASIFAIKLRLVNFLRDLADKFRVEELARRKRPRGDIDLSDILKAFGDGLFRHRPTYVREAKEKALLEWWFWKIYVPRVDRLIFKGGRGYSFGDVARQVLSGLGEHAGAEAADFEAGQLVQFAWLCSIGDFLASVGRMKVLRLSEGEIAEEARKAYIKGDISSRELALLDTTFDWPEERGAEDKFLEEMYEELREWFDHFLSPEYKEEVRGG